MSSNLLGFGVQCLILGSFSSFLLSSPLGECSQLACTQMYPSESRLQNQAFVNYSFSGGPRHLRHWWPSDPPTCITPLTEEDKEAETCAGCSQGSESRSRSSASHPQHPPLDSCREFSRPFLVYVTEPCGGDTPGLCVSCVTCVP